MSGQLSKMRDELSEKADREMGEQLTDQYGRATGGMREVLKFGAMMMMLRAHLAQRGQGSGNGIKGDGMKGWLEKNCPDVSRQTAARFEDVAKAVQKACELPARATKALTFEQIVTADPRKLDGVEKKAQDNLFAFVDGTSQKSLLDDYRESKERGGDTSGKAKRKTAAQRHAEFLANCRKDFDSVFAGVERLVKSGQWKAPSIDDAVLEAAADASDKFVKQARKWLRTPKKQRADFTAEDAESSEETE